MTTFVDLPLPDSSFRRVNLRQSPCAHLGAAKGRTKPMQCCGRQTINACAKHVICVAAERPVRGVAWCHDCADYRATT